jgi:hypothetical protein
METEKDTGRRLTGTERYDRLFLNAFAYPAKPRLLLKCVALSLLGFLVLPFLVLLGYVYRVGEQTATAGYSDGALPALNLRDWRALSKKGAVVLPLLLAFLLPAGFVYPLLPSVVYYPVVFLSGYAAVGFYVTYLGRGGVREAYESGEFSDLLTTAYYLKAFGLYVLIYGILYYIVIQWGTFAFVVSVDSVFSVDLMARTLAVPESWAWYSVAVFWYLIYFPYVVLVSFGYWGSVYHYAEKRGLVGTRSKNTS